MTISSIFCFFFFFEPIISYSAQTHVQIAESFFKAKYFEQRSKQNTALNPLSCLFVINLQERLEQELITDSGAKSTWGLPDLVQY